MLAGGEDAAVADRLERLLQAPAQLGLLTRAQCLQYLGGLFRTAISAPPHLTDLQVRLTQGAVDRKQVFAFVCFGCAALMNFSASLK